MSRVCEGDVAQVFSDMPDSLVRWRNRIHESDPASRVEVADLLWRRFPVICKHYGLRTRAEQAEGFLVGAIRNSGDLTELRCRIDRDEAMYPTRAVKDLVLWNLLIWEREHGSLPGSRVLGILRSVVEPYVLLIAGDNQVGGCLLRRVPVLGFVPMDADMCGDAAWWIVAQFPQAPPELLASYDPTRGGLEKYFALQSTRCDIQVTEFQYILPSGRAWIRGDWTLLSDAFFRSPLGRYLAEEPDHRVICAPIVYKTCATCLSDNDGRCPDCGRAAVAGGGMSCHPCHKQLPWVFEGAGCSRGHPDDPRATRRGRQDKRLISPKIAVDPLADETFGDAEEEARSRFVGSPYVLEQYWTSACGNICDLAWDRCPLCQEDRWLWKCRDNLHHSAAEEVCPSSGCARRENRILHLYAQPPHPQRPTLSQAQVVEFIRAERKAIRAQIGRKSEVFWDPFWGECPAARARELRKIVRDLEELARCARTASAEVTRVCSDMPQPDVRPGVRTDDGSRQNVPQTGPEHVHAYLKELRILALGEQRDRLRSLLAGLELELADEGDHVRALLALGRGR